MALMGMIVRITNLGSCDWCCWKQLNLSAPPPPPCEPRHLLLNMCCPLTNVIYNYTNSIDINTMTAVPNRAQRPTEHWHDTSPSANHHNRCMITRMILPQVHLRKPCYEFPFGFKSSTYSYMGTSANHHNRWCPSVNPF